MIVSRCYDLSGLLGPLANPEARASEDQSEDHDLSRYPGANKQTSEAEQSSLRDMKPLIKAVNGHSFQTGTFYGGRNFR